MTLGAALLLSTFSGWSVFLLLVCLLLAVVGFAIFFVGS